MAAGPPDAISRYLPGGAHTCQVLTYNVATWVPLNRSLHRRAAQPSVEVRVRRSLDLSDNRLLGVRPGNRSSRKTLGCVHSPARRLLSLGNQATRRVRQPEPLFYTYSWLSSEDSGDHIRRGQPVTHTKSTLACFQGSSNDGWPRPEIQSESDGCPCTRK